MTHDKIDYIPEESVVTYVRILIGFRPQKEDAARVCITARGNLIKTPGDLTTRTIDVTIFKILWNSILSTKGATFEGFDVLDLYLGTDMECCEYMKMPVSLFQQYTIDQYNMETHK